MLDLNNKFYFLNSLSWMVLLITFLQDIIKPQILPKLLSNKNNSLKCYQINYANYYNDEWIDKSFDSFLNNIQEKNIFLPESFFDKKSLFEIYKQQIINDKKLLEKNNLSSAEIFLYFIEFIIFYFKKDLIYVNCSIENEGYESMNNILQNNDNYRNNKDGNFIEYFKKIYFKKINFYDEEIEKEGEILIRDPFDPNYNPAQL